ncbi:protein Bouncer [Neosynchiropus ocellatus]
MRCLHVTLLWLYLLAPSVRCKNLRCFFTPIAETHKKNDFVRTECPPDEVCFKAIGRYGKFEGLSGRGCLAAKDCGRADQFKYRGVEYTMTFDCCEWSYCNSCVGLTAGTFSIFLVLLTLFIFNA